MHRKASKVDVYWWTGEYAGAICLAAVMSVFDWDGGEWKIEEREGGSCDVR